MIRFAFYVGIGALFHALFLGPHVDWSSAWTFGWLLVWPIMLFIAFWSAVFGILLWVIVVCVIVGGLIWLWDATFIARTMRTMRTMRKAAKLATQRRGL